MKKAFVFPGQGSQSLNMGKDFYDNFEVAREVFNIVNDSVGKKLSNIMFGDNLELLTQTENAQPAIMCVSIAILKVLEKETGKTIENLCNFVAGHSLGEYSALCAGDSLSLTDTAKLLKIRGESFANSAKNGKGAMAALLGATVDQAEEVAKQARQNNEVCSVANDNTVGQVVLSGNENSINKAIEIATAMGIKKAIKLQVSGAFHSELMKPAVINMISALNEVSINIPKVPLITNTTAKEIKDSNSIKESLIQQITSRVKWRETMIAFESQNVDNIVEIGSGKVLSGMVLKTCPNMKTNFINSVETLKEFISSL